MIPCTIAHQTPPTMVFSWQEYWSGLPFPPPRDPPHPGIKLISPVSSVVAGRFFTIEPPRKTPVLYVVAVYVNPKLLIYSLFFSCSWCNSFNFTRMNQTESPLSRTSVNKDKGLKPHDFSQEQVRSTLSALMNQRRAQWLQKTRTK